MMPCSCAVSRASAIWRAMTMASGRLSVAAPPLWVAVPAISSASVWPSTNSMTSARMPSALLESMDGGDVGMIQRGEQLRFAAKPCHRIVVVKRGIRQDLQGDVAVEPRVARAIHLAHAARRAAATISNAPNLDRQRATRGCRDYSGFRAPVAFRLPP